MEQIRQLAAKQHDRLFFYSPYNFLRGIADEDHNKLLNKTLQSWYAGQEDHYIFNVTVNQKQFYFLYEFLTWDSNYFGQPTFKLFTVMYVDCDFTELLEATKAFKDHLNTKGNGYCFGNFPAEDTFLI